MENRRRIFYPRSFNYLFLFPRFFSLSFLDEVRRRTACTSIEIDLREADRSRRRRNKNKDPGRGVEMDERNHKIPDEDARERTWYDDPSLLTKFLSSLTDRFELRLFRFTLSSFSINRVFY